MDPMLNVGAKQVPGIYTIYISACLIQTMFTILNSREVQTQKTDLM